MKHKAFYLVCGLVLVSTLAFGQTPEELIEEADAIYAQMQDMESAQEALKLPVQRLFTLGNRLGANKALDQVLVGRIPPGDNQTGEVYRITNVKATDIALRNRNSQFIGCHRRSLPRLAQPSARGGRPCTCRRC